MANYSNLKAAIEAAIRTNGNQEITGQVLQDVLNSIVSVIGANYTFAGVATPATNPGTPDQNVIYLAMEGGTYTNFNGMVLPAGISLLMWNGTWTSETVMYGDGCVFDISVYKSSGGTLATFADLSAALDGGNNIPASARKGGMSIKYVQTSDNKYVQARLTANSFTTDVTQWQCVDEKPTAGSHNLVESGGVDNAKLYDDLSNIDILGYEQLEEIHGQVDNTEKFLFRVPAYNYDYTRCTHKVIAVSPGDVVKFEGVRYSTGMFVLKSYEKPNYQKDSVDADICASMGFVFVPSNTSEYTMPEDAHYIAIRCYEEIEVNGVLRTPKIYTIKRISINGKTIFGGYKNYTDTLRTDVSNALGLSEIESVNGWVDITSKFVLDYGFHKVVKINKERPYLRVRSSAVQDFIYFVLNSYEKPVQNNVTPDFSSSFSGRQQVSGYNKVAILDFTASDANYIAFNVKNSSNVDVSPQEFEWLSMNEICTIEKSVSELPRIKGWVDSSNVFYVASNYGLHSVAKINKDKPYLRVKTSPNDFFTYFVLNSYKEPVVGANTPDFCSTISGAQYVKPVNSVAIIDLSATDANYIAFNVFNVSKNIDVSPQEFEFFSKYEIDKLEAEWWEGDSELHNNIIQIKRRVNDTTQQVNYNAYLNHTPILSFLWFSDLHDDIPRLKRIMKFANQYPSYYDDIVCTGDANDKFTNNFDYWHDLGCDNVLLSMGNHEQYYETEEGGVTTGHHDVSQEQMYNKYYKDFVQGQGVVYQTNKVYWYKDYINNKIRLINICPSLYHISSEAVAEQLTWFEEVLADAAENNLAVVVMNHYKATPCVFIDSNFTQLDGVTGGTTMTDLLNAVKDFKTSGGEFICWLSGHEHQDRLSYKDTWNDQLFITINCAMMESSYSDMSRVAGTRSEDCFNMIGFDVDKKLIKMVRVGANVDYLLRPRNLIVINYTNNQILNQK